MPLKSNRRWTQIFKITHLWSAFPADVALNPQESSLISVYPRPSAVEIPNLESRLISEVTIFYPTQEILAALGETPPERPAARCVSHECLFWHRRP